MKKAATLFRRPPYAVKTYPYSITVDLVVWARTAGEAEGFVKRALESGNWLDKETDSFAVREDETVCATCCKAEGHNPECED